jgi:hypothetical protein
MLPGDAQSGEFLATLQTNGTTGFFNFTFPDGNDSFKIPSSSTYFLSIKCIGTQDDSIGGFATYFKENLLLSHNNIKIPLDQPVTFINNELVPPPSTFPTLNLMFNQPDLVRLRLNVTDSVNNTHIIRFIAQIKYIKVSFPAP